MRLPIYCIGVKLRIISYAALFLKLGYHVWLIYLWSAVAICVLVFILLFYLICCLLFIFILLSMKKSILTAIC